MGIALDLLALRNGAGPLALGAAGAARLEAVRPVFDQVSRETARADRGPIPAAFMLAIAWGESSFRPDVNGPPVAGGLVAQGLMQILSSHYGTTMYANVDPELAFTWGPEIAHEPLANVRAGASLLLLPPPRGFGFGGPVRDVLKRYGGFVRSDPSDYIADVESRYLFLAARELLS